MFFFLNNIFAGNRCPFFVARQTVPHPGIDFTGRVFACARYSISSSDFVFYIFHVIFCLLLRVSFLLRAWFRFWRDFYWSAERLFNNAPLRIFHSFSPLASRPLSSLANAQLRLHREQCANAPFSAPVSYRLPFSTVRSRVQRAICGSNEWEVLSNGEIETFLFGSGWRAERRPRRRPALERVMDRLGSVSGALRFGIYSFSVCFSLCATS